MAQEGAFVWYELITTDTAAAAKFYSAVVGWNCEKAPGETAGGAPYFIYSVPGFPMGIGGMMALTPEMKANGARPGWLGYVSVADVDAKAAEFAANGGAVYMPGTDIPHIGRFAVVADPHGAVIYLFKPLPPPGETPARPEPNAPGTVGWRELYAGDGVEAFAFYSKMFGWKKSQAMDMGPMGVYQLFAIDGEDAGAVMTKPPQIPAPFWNYYFIVDAIDAAVERVKAGGGRVINGPMEVPGGRWIIQGMDPQGAMFSLLAAKR